MRYYRVCPRCGCHLDPGEVCDCGKEEAVANAANIDNGERQKKVNAQATTLPLSLYQNYREDSSVNYQNFDITETEGMCLKMAVERGATGCQ